MTYNSNTNSIINNINSLINQQEMNKSYDSTFNKRESEKLNGKIITYIKPEIAKKIHIKYLSNSSDKKVKEIKEEKSLRDDPEPVDNERRKKGNLYDYYSSKIPKKKKNYEKHENNDEFNINSKKKKTILNKNDYNYAHSKPKHIKRNNSDQSGDMKRF